MSNFLSSFPGGPRPVQEEILREVEKVWTKADAIAIVAPVASGKSRIAVAIGGASYQPTVITAPTRVLVDQYRNDFPNLTWVGRKSDYVTDRQFYRAKKAAEFSKLLVTNYHAVCANRLQKPTMVIDEAHNVIRLHQERHAFHIWRDDYFWPEKLDSLGDVLGWLETVRDAKLERVLGEIKNAGTYTIELGESYRRGSYGECMKFIPLNIKDKKPWLWNHSVQKLVLMSATIGKQDLKELGLDRKRCCVIEAPSPIPEENRPVIYDPIAPMGFDVKPEGVKLIAERINQMLAEKGGSGLIHATYDVAARLRTLLSPERVIYHTKENRHEMYERFLRSPGKVLVGSGFSEGIDLKDDLARWQVIAQVPFPNMRDPAVAAKAREDQDWYHWETAKTLNQMFGRVCRSPVDYGETWVLDSNFGRFHKRMSKHLPNVLTTNQYTATDMV